MGRPAEAVPTLGAADAAAGWGADGVGVAAGATADGALGPPGGSAWSGWSAPLLSPVGAMSPGAAGPTGTSASPPSVAVVGATGWSAATWRIPLTGAPCSLVPSGPGPGVAPGAASAPGRRTGLASVRDIGLGSTRVAVRVGVPFAMPSLRACSTTVTAAPADGGAGPSYRWRPRSGRAITPVTATAPGADSTVERPRPDTGRAAPSG